MTTRTRTSRSYRPLHSPRTPKPLHSLRELMCNGSITILRNSKA